MIIKHPKDITASVLHELGGSQDERFKEISALRSSTFTHL